MNTKEFGQNLEADAECKARKMPFTACLFSGRNTVCDELHKRALQDMERRGGIQPVNKLRLEVGQDVEEVNADGRKDKIANPAQRLNNKFDSSVVQNMMQLQDFVHQAAKQMKCRFCSKFFSEEEIADHLVAHEIENQNSQGVQSPQLQIHAARVAPADNFNRSEEENGYGDEIIQGAIDDNRSDEEVSEIG